MGGFIDQNAFDENMQTGVYLNIAFVTIWTWDLIISLGEECALLVEKVTFSQVIYIIARLSSILCMVVATVVTFETQEMQQSTEFNGQVKTLTETQCHPQILLVGWTLTISTAANSLLMFFRIRAVFSHSTRTVVAFAILWVATLGATLTIPISMSQTLSEFSTTGLIFSGEGLLGACFNFVFPTYVFSAYLISAVYDALLFLAVTYRLLFYHLYADGRLSRLRSFFNGEGLGLVSKTLLQTGQSYYLVTVGMNILNMVFIFSPIMPILQGANNSVFMVPCVAVTNIMSSMVYRQLKLGILRQDPWDKSKQQSTSTSTSTMDGLRFFRRSGLNIVR